MGQYRKKPGDDDHYRKSDESWRAPVGGFRGHPEPASPATSSGPASSGGTSGNSWAVQDRTEDLTTQVKGGFSHDRQAPTTEFLILDRDGSGGQHIVIDDMGEEIYNGSHKDKR